MLIDDIKIKISAGSGGKGAVAFNTNMKSLGPAGASGGKGGSVYALGVSDISALRQFRFKKEFEAGDGGDGNGQFRDGKDGADLVLKLPTGTVIHNLTRPRLDGESRRASNGSTSTSAVSSVSNGSPQGNDIEIQKVGERVLLAKGGIGGRGNFHFRSSTNTSPTQFQGGRPGEAFDLRLELKLIADVGFVGLPNAGKSSMLNTLTKAKAKVANYPFTTLEPNLGAYYELILADIPGLIEGSSTGRGLGIKFLRHIERTRILFHFISVESLDPEKDYKTIRKELKAYNKELQDKPEYLFLSKSDLADEAMLKEKSEILKKLNPNMTAISINDPESIRSVEKILNRIQALK
ncbi:MAG: GTPase ObgE [bacterium]|nr:GTPase ObgE [bacterium]